MTESRFMSISDVQRKLGVGRSTVYNMLYDNRFQSVKIGRYRRITRESFDAYVNDLLCQLDPTLTS